MTNEVFSDAFSQDELQYMIARLKEALATYTDEMISEDPLFVRQKEEIQETIDRYTAMLADAPATIERTPASVHFMPMDAYGCTSLTHNKEEILLHQQDCEWLSDVPSPYICSFLSVTNFYPTSEEIFYVSQEIDQNRETVIDGHWEGPKGSSVLFFYSTYNGIAVSETNCGSRIDVLPYLDGDEKPEECFLEKTPKEAAEDVKAFLKERANEWKLFEKIREICGNVRKSAVNVSMIRTWKEWAFTDEMILEAATRSASSANAIPYMNKILTDWKKDGIFEVKDIPEKSVTANAEKKFVSPAVDAINAKADRERYYALLREKAISKADKTLTKANQNVRFKELSAELASMEISLAKAEVFEPKKLPALLERKQALLALRGEVLAEMGIHEEELIPQFICQKCQDTGFLKNGKACDCYKK